MNHPTALLLTLALLAAAPAARADTITSSASSLASKSVGTSSDSISGSSNASSGGDKKVAAGPYEVVQVAEAQGKPGLQRLTLRAADAEFKLDLPADTAVTAGVTVGQTVLVQARPYGYAFALAQAPQQPFFLTLDRGWEGELRSQAVK